MRSGNSKPCTKLPRLIQAQCPAAMVGWKTLDGQASRPLPYPSPVERNCRRTAPTATRLLDNRRIFFPGNGPVHAAAGEGDLSLDCPHRDKSRNGEPDNPPHPARAPRSWLANIPGRHGPRLHKALTLWHSECS